VAADVVVVAGAEEELEGKNTSRPLPTDADRHLDSIEVACTKWKALDVL